MGRIAGTAWADAVRGLLIVVAPEQTTIRAGGKAEDVVPRDYAERWLRQKDAERRERLDARRNNRWAYGIAAAALILLAALLWLVTIPRWQTVAVQGRPAIPRSFAERPATGD
jgi:hypothetical protein